MKTMQPVLIGGQQVYVDLNCGEVTSQEYQEVRIEEQGCDRCGAEFPRWVKVWAEQ